MSATRKISAFYKISCWKYKQGLNLVCETLTMIKETEIERNENNLSRTLRHLFGYVFYFLPSCHPDGIGFCKLFQLCYFE